MRKYFVLAIALTLAITLGQFSSAQNSTSTTFTVNTLNDSLDASLADGLCADTSGSCSLRAAIQQANSDPLHDTIGFSVTGTIELTTGLPELLTNVTINGPGANQLIVRRGGTTDYRIFTVVPGVTAAISGLTMSNGRAPLESGSRSVGGGILNSGTLVLSDSVVTSNSTAPAQPGFPPTLTLGGGGGIRNDGTLTMLRCTVNGNSTGAGSLTGNRNTGTEGGGIFNSGMLIMIDSIISGNATADGLEGAFGSATLDPSAGGGGGIRNDGTLMMTGCIVSSNTTGRGRLFGRGSIGYAGGSGGGISNSGTLSLTDCDVSGNSTGNGADATSRGGNGGDGAGIINFISGNLGPAITTIADCSLSHNRTGRGGTAIFPETASDGGNAGSGGGIANAGTMTISKTTIDHNVTGPGGDGLRNGGRAGNGGGIYQRSGISGSMLTVSDCTISGNATGHGGSGKGERVNFASGGDGGGVWGAVKLSNSTVVLNSTGIAGAASRDGLGGGLHGSAQIISTIVALNSTPTFNEGRDVFGAFASSGYNYIGISSGGCCFNETDLRGSDANSANLNLGPLADNGGATPTHELLPGSLAIDKGLARDVDGQPALLDQRGATKPFDDSAISPAPGGDNSDIGAFERQSSDAAPTPTPTASLTVVQFSAPVFQVTEGCAPAEVTVKRTGPIDGTTEVTYLVNNRTASQRGDFTYASGRITFGPGDDTKTISVLISEDAYAEGTEDFMIFLAEVSGGTLGSPNPAAVQIHDNETTDGVANPIDNAGTFVCQHYHDFLGRQADPDGLNFWTNQITSCGTDASCLAEKRENVSAAFFLSIEFQQTGYYVIRVNKAAFGNVSNNPAYLKFLADTREIGRGLVVGQPDFDALLEANKQRYVEQFVSGPEFQWASSRSAEQYVDLLFANTSVTPTPAERDAAISAYGGGDTIGRARALRSVVETGSVYNGFYNSGFVLMQYFGYLRRNPSDPPDNDLNGYNFWFNKLSNASLPGEDMRDARIALARVKRAEMVKAFIISGEYRGRFFGDVNRGQ